MTLIANDSSSLLRCFILVVLAIAPAAAQTPAPSPYSITGTVINSVTGVPIPRCHLVPSKIDQGTAILRRIPSQQEGIDTDEHGHFTVLLPTAGRWSLRASAKGYRPQEFDEHEGFSSAIVLTEQIPTFDLLFRLAPDSVITGVILDEGNEPVRQAQIAAYSVPRLGSEGSQTPVSRGFANTDDLGHYEVAGLTPGDYRISVSARPWYAQAPQLGRSRPDVPQLEPSLDVVYARTWFPGVPSSDAAEVITLHEGETRRADLQLLPIPAVHLRVALPSVDPSGLGSNRLPVRFPQVTSVSANGIMPLTMSTSQGELDVGALAPGRYRIQTPDENGQIDRSTIIEVTANSARNLDMATAAATSASVMLSIDGDPGTESLPIAFVDANNDHDVFRSSPSHDGGRLGGRSPLQNRQGQGGQRSQRLPAASTPAASDHAARTLDLPSGRYFVYQSGSANYFLSGLTQGTKEIPGRMVTIPSGESSLTVHIATGRANVSGITTLAGKPVAGALVLLVPITLNEPGSIAETRRDQTNTDGSYDLNSVIPGQYILIAIDHGWNVNWNDPSTLARYLTNGVPLDLRNPTTVKQNIIAQLP